MDSNISPETMMLVRASREIADNQIVFVGIGLPNLACNLAKKLHAPNIELVYEAGVIGAAPERIPISIGDPALVAGSLGICSQADIFQYYLQGGKVDLGFLGGAQIDPFGNINSTVIGSYDHPKVRLPGSGGACAIATHSKKTLVIMKLSLKSFVKSCDFITSPGVLNAQGEKRDNFLANGMGPVKIITDHCVFSWNKKQYQVTEIYPSSSKQQIIDLVEWDIVFSDELKNCSLPSKEEENELKNLYKKA